MTNPEGDRQTWHNSWFKEARTEVDEDLSISAWELAFNNKNGPWSGKVGVTSNDKPIIEKENCPMESHSTNDKDLISEM